MKHEGCVSFRTTWWRQMTNVCAYYLQGKMLLKTNEGLLVCTRKLSHKQLILVFSKHFRLIFFFWSYWFVYRVGCTRSHDSVTEALIGHGVLYFLTRVFKIILWLFYYIRNHMFFLNPRCWDYRKIPFYWKVPPTKKLRTKCVFRMNKNGVLRVQKQQWQLILWNRNMCGRPQS